MTDLEKFKATLIKKLTEQQAETDGYMNDDLDAQTAKELEQESEMYEMFINMVNNTEV